MKKKTSRPLLTTGTSTLLLIFVSLCLLTFAVLSFLSARADQNLSRKTAERTSAYYEACNQAEDRLGETDRMLEKIWQETANEKAYFQAVRETFEDMDFDEESRMLSFSVPLTDTQVLTVTLKLQTPESGSTFYTIRGWKTVNTAEWTADTRQNVYVQTENADAEGE
ncbi:MAG: hypothetical protein EGR15_03085 [Lachnospiraceae bacterium]|nr:hypothetical protein [Lachnospiraceae bacterium]